MAMILPTNDPGFSIFIGQRAVTALPSMQLLTGVIEPALRDVIHRPEETKPNWGVALVKAAVEVVADDYVSTHHPKEPDADLDQGTRRRVVNWLNWAWHQIPAPKDGESDRLYLIREQIMFSLLECWKPSEHEGVSSEAFTCFLKIEIPKETYVQEVIKVALGHTLERLGSFPAKYTIEDLEYWVGVSVESCCEIVLPFFAARRQKMGGLKLAQVDILRASANKQQK